VSDATATQPVGFASMAGAVAHVFSEALGDSVLVGGEDGHHLQRVRRVRAGERITVADGTGHWRPYVVTRSAHGHLTLAAAGDVAREPSLAPALAVAFALSKGPKPETIVSGLTELGVDRIVPFRSARAVVRWEGDRVPAATARLRRVARESAMQCRRSRIPDVAEPVELSDLASHPAVVLGDPAGVPASNLASPPGGEWLAVIGPEGGLDAAERDQLAASRRAARVAVGPYVLRTETAALALAAVLTTRRRPSAERPGGHGA
jgi:16S rRNA (uracil1498-N3)-methyltransferase